jgi:chromosome segregation protein
MSPSASSRRSGTENSKRSKRVDSFASSETGQADEYQSSPLLKSSPTISREDLKSFAEDIAPHLSELAEVRDNISNSLHKVENVMEKVTGKFKGRMDIVNGVGESWGKEQEQREEIDRLEKLTESLFLWKEKERKQLDSRIETLMEELSASKREVEEVEQKHEQKYAVRQAALGAQEARLHADYENRKREIEAKEVDLKRKIKEESAKDISDLKKTIGNLNRTTKKLKDENQKLDEDLSTLKSSHEKSERAYNSLKQENASLQSNIETIQKEFLVAEQSDEYLLVLCH